ncbi:MAG: AAA family ATPase [Deltaproteobacteria bacterium]|nr:AAA family ATPase [Deltaproteobacteria bacterium]
MAKLLGLRVQNYRSLADVSLGKVKWNQGDELPGLACLIGANGSGKSTVLDALGFIADTLKEGVEAACDKPQRGGFQRLRTQGSNGSIKFHLNFRETPKARPITYSFSVTAKGGIPYVEEESLLQGRTEGARGRPIQFVHIKEGKGVAWPENAVPGDKGAKRAVVKSDRATLGVASLGILKDHPRIAGMRAYIQDWYLSYFVPDAARALPPAGAQKHLNRDGSNIGNVLQYLERKHPAAVKSALGHIAKAIPGLSGIKTKVSPDGRLLLEFNEKGFQDPFFQQSMSDGTLKMFAYLLLLLDPQPPRFVVLEEPENGLYHQLFGPLALEFLSHTMPEDAKTQLLLTTHAPLFVDMLKADQVWLLQKDAKGFTRATRASDLPEVSAMTDEGLPLGSLWFSGHFGTRVSL